jgi:1,4-alpha-glucan branching enzyme
MEDLNMKERDKRRTKKMENSVQKERIKKNGKKVEFKLHAPEAKAAFLAGEFNQWDIRSMPMKRGKNENWKIKVSFLPGRYEYKYFVGNQWVEDLPGTELVPNPFGTQNLFLWVE